jgi:hypothetical protein
MKRNIINEIENKRFRYNYASVAYGNYTIKDIDELEQKTTKDFRNSSFNLDYLSVSICSSFETFFRFEVKSLVDKPHFDVQRLNLLEEVKDFKPGLPIVKETLHKKISIGELVSHLIKINSVSSINRVFSYLLQTDFLHALRTMEANCKSEHYLSLINYWRKNYDQIIKDLQSLYELRNIACHEFGYIIEVSKEVLHRYLKNGTVFLKIACSYLSKLDYTPQFKKPRTSDVTRAKKSFQKSEKQLDELIEKICQAAQKVWFDTVYLNSDLINEIFLWRRYRKKVVKAIGEMWGASTSDREMYWNNMEMLTIEKIGTLSDRYQYLFDEIENSTKIQSFE